MNNFKNNIASVFFKFKISANFLTALGFLCAFISGVLIYKGSFLLAGSFLILSGFFDLMDGAVARFSKKSTSFGGILDSSLDQIGRAHV